MRSVFLSLFVAGLLGCSGAGTDNLTSSGSGSSGAGTSAGSTSAAATSSATGREATSAGSTGTSSGSAATTGGSTSSSSGSSTGGQTSTGSATGGSSSGGSSSGGSSSGGSMITGAQACMDYIAGLTSFTACVGGQGSGLTEQQCETNIGFCTAADIAIIDGIGVCLEDLVCDTNVDDEEMAASVCAAPISMLSADCSNAGQPDGGGGETTTTGGSGG